MAVFGAYFSPFSLYGSPPLGIFSHLDASRSNLLRFLELSSDTGAGAIPETLFVLSSPFAHPAVSTPSPAYLSYL